MRYLRVVAVGGFVLLAAAASLFGAGLRPSPEPSEPPRLSASLEIRRLNPQPDTVALAVTNAGDTEVTVRHVRLVSASLAESAGTEVSVTVPADATRDVFIPVPTAMCGDDIAPATAPATAELRVSSRGVEHAVALPLAHPNGTLDRLVGRDCATALLARTARVEFGDWRSAPSGVLLGELRVIRVGGDLPITLDSVTGNPHYAVTPVTAGPPLGELPPGTAELSVPVEVDANRCDAHALAEAKKPWLFPFRLTVGAWEVPGEVTVSETDQAAMEAMQAVRC
ncbi:hypothetical protein LX16_2866 [Stackebrandtia albiflava]|uniref:Uncharacterized protein n=1 Tax=Stackebrandtia albiflava TaxID=406432 RepID=A0A562V2T1_9ACTN|nr:hypothetical protein [Stackebrandtia albiflava]TWJ12117.1 hypothetical protein LX16_2866 [Stackebrandtia albiflava]